MVSQRDLVVGMVGQTVDENRGAYIMSHIDILVAQGKSEVLKEVIARAEQAEAELQSIRVKLKEEDLGLHINGKIAGISLIKGFAKEAWRGI